MNGLYQLVQISGYWDYVQDPHTAPNPYYVYWNDQWWCVGAVIGPFTPSMYQLCNRGATDASNPLASNGHLWEQWTPALGKWAAVPAMSIGGVSGVALGK